MPRLFRPVGNREGLEHQWFLLTYIHLTTQEGYKTPTCM